ncbi:MAG: hypothetical protein ACTSPY_09405 [Candidatus Helarchaeota archaeon]
MTGRLHSGFVLSIILMVRQVHGITAILFSILPASLTIFSTSW